MENSYCEFSAVVAFSIHPLAHIRRYCTSSSARERRCDRRHRSESAGDNVPRLTVTPWKSNKNCLNYTITGSGRGLLLVLQFGFEPIIRICVKIIRPWLHCVLPPHHLAHARNAGNSYREFCAVVLSLACRSHVHTMQRETHNCVPPCVDVDTPLEPGQPYSPSKGNSRGNISVGLDSASL